ncbi:MAG: Smr/MutS family protein [Polaromonas sp.]|nr:Smr/MutS family protein [Polaromonas sp.]
MLAPSSPRQKSLLVRNLKDLLPVRRELELRARLEAERQATIWAAAARVRAEKELFSRAVGRVMPLASQHRPGGQAKVERPRPAPVASQRLLDELAVMQEALSDGFDVESLLDADESLSFRRPGIGVDVVRKLRRGSWSIQRQLDLHGFRREDARNALGAFIREANKAGVRCVRVVHGKGLGSPGKAPVLKGKVQSWLVQKKEVLAFVQARPAAGGAGALVVLLVQG